MATVIPSYWQKGHIWRISGYLDVSGKFDTPEAVAESVGRKLWVYDSKTQEYVPYNARRDKDLNRIECANSAYEASETYFIALRRPPELILTMQEINDIITVTATEVDTNVDAALWHRQLAAVIDTILNRIFLEKDHNVRKVLERDRQFSDISGNANAVGSVDKVPRSRVTPQIIEQSMRHFQNRAEGHPSIIGGNFNYFNPRKTMPSWGPDVMAQAEKNGHIFGKGQRIHYHGTAEGNKRAPAFKVTLPVPFVYKR